jgi:hypothetical protein
VKLKNYCYKIFSVLRATFDLENSLFEVLDIVKFNEKINSNYGNFDFELKEGILIKNLEKMI